jgi:hypothetical protein
MRFRPKTAAPAFPFLAAILLWLAPAVVGGQTGRGTLTGRGDSARAPDVTRGASFTGVVITGSPHRPLVDVEVTLSELELSTRTNDRGEFLINDIPPGRYQVNIRRFGFNPFDVKIAFAANQTVRHELFLTPAVTLDSVKVIANASIIPGFDERRKLGLGQFLTRAELEKQEGRKLSDILSQLRSVRIQAGKGNHTWFATNRGVGGWQAIGSCYLATTDSLAFAKPCVCYAPVFVDRALVYRGDAKEPLFDLSSIDTGSIEAIEYYASTAITPMEFTTPFGVNCGVLVIWTRRS